MANIVCQETAKDGANSKVYKIWCVEIYVKALKRWTRSRIKHCFEIRYSIGQNKLKQNTWLIRLSMLKGNTDETFTEWLGSDQMVHVDCWYLTSNGTEPLMSKAAFGIKTVETWASGSVSYLFDNKGKYCLQVMMLDAIFELLLEADALRDDVEAEWRNTTVYTAPTDLHKAIVVCEFILKNSDRRLSGEDLKLEKLHSVLKTKTLYSTQT